MKKHDSPPSSADLDVIQDQAAPVKGQLAPTSAPATSGGSSRRKLLFAAGGLGLLLLGLGIGLAIGLPLAFSKRGSSSSSRGGEAVQLIAGGADTPKGITRTFYLAADPVDWDYLPAGRNLCSGKAFTDEAALSVRKGVGSKYKKAAYRQYADGSFKVR
jgi:hypothetical protein